MSVALHLLLHEDPSHVFPNGPPTFVQEPRKELAPAPVLGLAPHPRPQKGCIQEWRSHVGEGAGERFLRFQGESHRKPGSDSMKEEVQRGPSASGSQS